MHSGPATAVLKTQKSPALLPGSSNALKRSVFCHKCREVFLIGIVGEQLE